MASPGLTPLLQGQAQVNDGKVWRKVLLSHAITRLGTQGWTFIAPLVLVRFAPGSILGPAVWGMVTMLGTMLFAPGLGKWADRSNRKLVICYGVLLQFAAVTGSTVVILVSLMFQAPGETENNWSALSLYVGFGVIEKLGMQLSDVAVKREWVPQLFKGEEARGFNSRMSQIDLSTEVVGPFIAGLTVSAGSSRMVSSRLPYFIDATDFGFIAAGILNMLSFWPQLALLLNVYHTHADLLQPVPVDRAQASHGSAKPNTDGAWATWFRHPGGLRLLSLSYALLYLSVLSPHGALITAFLMIRQVPPPELSLMRGAGAILGIFGTIGRPALGKQVGHRCADAISVCWMAAWMLVAMVAYCAVGDSEGLTVPMFVFMAAVCIGRPGLYAFELGVLNEEQELADQRYRTAIGSVDSALTSGGTLTMYGASIILDRPEQFGILTMVSSFFVCCGAVAYILWTTMYRSVKHRHYDKDGHGHHGHSHEHSHAHGHDLDDHVHHEHTMQMNEMREAHDSGGYLHEHIIYEPGRCAIQ